MADAATFRVAFPEFSDPAKYPDPMLGYWLPVCERSVNADRWGEQTDHGIYLVLAHRLSLAAKSRLDAQFGKAPGAASGVVASKSVDKVSISYDTTSASEEGAGWWNLTTYGQEYYRMVRVFGAGPVQVGLPSDPVETPAAYYGPIWGA